MMAVGARGWKRENIWLMSAFIANKRMMCLVMKTSRKHPHMSNLKPYQLADKSLCKPYHCYQNILRKWGKTRYVSIHEFSFLHIHTNAEFAIISFVLHRKLHLLGMPLNKWNTNYKWHWYDHNCFFLAARDIFWEEPAFLQMAWKKKKNEAYQTHHYSCEALSSLVEAAKSSRAATDQQMGNEQEYKFPANQIINICCLHPGNTVNQMCHHLSRQNIITNWD